MLSINEIFYSIQGEGPFSGSPAVFVRLAGCNLKCSFCDTKHETVNSQLTAIKLFKTVQELSKGLTRLVVITGGEPFLQNLSKFVQIAYKSSWMIQIESNGTVNTHKFSQWYKVCLVVSPKGQELHPDLVQVAIAFKYVIRAGEVPELITGTDIEKVYVQPMDEKDPQKNYANMIWCREVVLRYGYNLSLQLHKIVAAR